MFLSPAVHALAYTLPLCWPHVGRIVFRFCWRPRQERLCSHPPQWPQHLWLFFFSEFFSPQSSISLNFCSSCLMLTASASRLVCSRHSSNFSTYLPGSVPSGQGVPVLANVASITSVVVYSCCQCDGLVHRFHNGRQKTQNIHWTWLEVQCLDHFFLSSVLHKS